MEVRHKGHEVTQEARRRWEAAVEQQDSVKSRVGRKKEKMIYETKGGENIKGDISYFQSIGIRGKCAELQHHYHNHVVTRTSRAICKREQSKSGSTSAGKRVEQF